MGANCCLPSKDVTDLRDGHSSKRNNGGSKRGDKKLEQNTFKKQLEGKRSK